MKLKSSLGIRAPKPERLLRRHGHRDKIGSQRNAELGGAENGGVREQHAWDAKMPGSGHGNKGQKGVATATLPLFLPPPLR